MPTKKEPKKTSQEPLQNKIKKLEETIQQLQAEVSEKNEKYLRTLADYQNAQKRMEKECVTREDELKKRLFLQLLDFQELLKKAAGDPNPSEGIKLLIANFEKFFEKEGVKSIESLGKPFDHSIHHAVSIVEKDDCTDDTVLDEVKKGYMLGDKLLRPSQVIVGKKKIEHQGGVEI
jgi:molecular chaperone GrpE